MPLVTTGGTTVSGATIQDESIYNADIAPDASIARSKLNITGGSIQVETTVGATHSLTTLAGQIVMVFGFCDVEQGHFGNEVVTLSYNSVTKDTAQSDDDNISANIRLSYALAYTETPGAATANIVLASGTGTIQNPRIFVLKITP